MINNDILNDILAHTGKSELDEFIKEYARDNKAFKNVFLEKFSPKPKSKSKREKPLEDYVKTIQKAFISSGINSRGRYRNNCEYFEFDAEAVSEKLEPLLEKARFYIRHDNKDEAILIAQKLIDTIPDHWDPDYDEDGDIQVIYDDAIDLLAEMLNEKLSNEQIEWLFSWYEKTVGDKKHEYVGLNTSLEVLEQCFASYSVDNFDRVLRIVNQRIMNARDYEKELAVMDKISLLKENNRVDDADNTIEEFIYYPRIRKIRLQRLLADKQYDQAIELLQEGIEIAGKKQERGTINEWQKELFLVYKQLQNKEKMVEITKELFVQGNEQQSSYLVLKEITPKAEWDEMLTWILRNLSDRGYYGSCELKADIFVEHQMWDDLWKLCKKSSIEIMRKYEKLLRPRYEKEIPGVYLQYVQRQAAITDKDAYRNVANMLNWMKSFEGGPAVVKKLVDLYRVTYKRRIYMMKELDRVIV